MCFSKPVSCGHHGRVPSTWWGQVGLRARGPARGRCVTKNVRGFHFSTLLSVFAFSTCFQGLLSALLSVVLSMFAFKVCFQYCFRLFFQGLLSRFVSSAAFGRAFKVCFQGLLSALLSVVLSRFAFKVCFQHSFQVCFQGCFQVCFLKCFQTRVPILFLVAGRTPTARHIQPRCMR